MLLLKLLSGLEHSNKLNDIEIKGVTSDTRQVESGFLFVCIKGTKFDGHMLAKDAVKSGAVAVVCEYSLGLENEVIVKNTHIAYAYICANYFDNPAKKLKLIAVTGTNGKTTITYILKHVIEEMGIKCGLIGTIHNEIDDITIPAKNTTPDAFLLHSMLAKMVEAGCEYAVLEASSHALDQNRLAGCHFAAAIFTNLTQDHLDYHESIESYYKAKRKLFDMCDNAIINIDDEYGMRIFEEVTCNKVSFSIEKDNADYTAKSITITSESSRFALVGNSVIARINYCMPGKFAVSNAMGAASCLLALGFEFNTVANALNTCKGVTGRCEVIKTDKDFTVIRDYAHSPDGLEKIISTLKEFAPKRVITLFGCAGNRDRTKRPIMAEIASRLSDYVILTSDNPRDEDPDKIVEDVIPGLLIHKTPYKVLVDRYEAIKWGLENAQKDDILLLAGKGHEDYQVLASGTIYFDEKEIVQKLAGDGEN